MSKTRASCFIRGSKHLETIKTLGLRPRAFICFSVFGTPDETIALVFDILHKAQPASLLSDLKSIPQRACLLGVRTKFQIVGGEYISIEEKQAIPYQYSLYEEH